MAKPNKGRDQKMKQMQAKREAIIRAEAAKSGIPENELDFFVKAKLSKKSPFTFLHEISNDVKVIFSQPLFTFINNLHAFIENDPAAKKAYQESFPDACKKVYEYISYRDSILNEVETILTENSEHLKDMGDAPLYLSWIECGPIIDRFSDIQDNIRDNIEGILETARSVMDSYNKTEEYAKTNNLKLEEPANV